MYLIIIVTFYSLVYFIGPLRISVFSVSCLHVKLKELYPIKTKVSYLILNFPCLESVFEKFCFRGEIKLRFQISPRRVDGHKLKRAPFMFSPCGLKARSNGHDS